MKKLFILIICILFFIEKSDGQESSGCISISGAVFSDAVSDLEAAFMGVGYEYRPVDFVGFELSGFAGKFDHDDLALDIASETDRINYLLLDGIFGGFSLSTKAYLTFNRENYWAIYFEYYLGSYAVKAYGKGYYQGSDLDAHGTSGMKFFHGMGLGVRIFIFENVDAMASIGGNSIDFTNALRAINFNTPPDVKVPTPSLDSFIVFKFGLMILLNKRE